jgi:hypothetical protein
LKESGNGGGYAVGLFRSFDHAYPPLNSITNSEEKQLRFALPKNRGFLK